MDNIDVDGGDDDDVVCFAVKSGRTENRTNFAIIIFKLISGIAIPFLNTDCIRSQLALKSHNEKRSTAAQLVRKVYTLA